MKEAKNQVLIDNLEDVVMKNERKEQACLLDGKPQISTLSAQERKGRASLQAREKAGELVIVSTDKIGKLAVIDTDMDKKCMEPHMQGDTVHTKEEVTKVEKHLNGAATHILRSFKFGEDWGHENRMKSACFVENNEIPSLNQLIKDHKETLATRPVCRAQVRQAPNGPLSSLVCQILDPFVQEADNERRNDLKSTEELCHEMKSANENIVRNGVRQGSYQKDGGRDQLGGSCSVFSLHYEPGRDQFQRTVPCSA